MKGVNNNTESLYFSEDATKSYIMMNGSNTKKGLFADCESILNQINSNVQDSVNEIIEKGSQYNGHETDSFVRNINSLSSIMLGIDGIKENYKSIFSDQENVQQKSSTYINERMKLLLDLAKIGTKIHEIRLRIKKSLSHWKVNSFVVAEIDKLFEEECKSLRDIFFQDFCRIASVFAGDSPDEIRAKLEKVLEINISYPRYREIKILPKNQNNGYDMESKSNLENNIERNEFDNLESNKVGQDDKKEFVNLENSGISQKGGLITINQDYLKDSLKNKPEDKKELSIQRWKAFALISIMYIRFSWSPEIIGFKDKNQNEEDQHYDEDNQETSPNNKKIILYQNTFGKISLFLFNIPSNIALSAVNMSLKFLSLFGVNRKNISSIFKELKIILSVSFIVGSNLMFIALFPMLTHYSIGKFAFLAAKPTLSLLLYAVSFVISYFCTKNVAKRHSVDYEIKLHTGGGGNLFNSNNIDLKVILIQLVNGGGTAILEMIKLLAKIAAREYDKLSLNSKEVMKKALSKIEFDSFIEQNFKSFFSKCGENIKYFNTVIHIESHLIYASKKSSQFQNKETPKPKLVINSRYYNFYPDQKDSIKQGNDEEGKLIYIL